MALSFSPTPQYERFRRYYQQLAPVWQKSKISASTATVFSFLAVSLFAWYAVRPTAQTILYLRREIQDKTIVNQQMEDKINKLIEVQSEYEALQDKLSLVTQAIPNAPEATELAIQLQNLASVSSASISALQVPGVPLSAEATPGAKLAPPKSLAEYSIQAALSGSYGAVKSFLDGLLTLRRILTIESMRISPRGEGVIGGEPVLQLSVKLKSYYVSP